MDVAKIEINSQKLFWISGINFVSPQHRHGTFQLIDFLRHNNIDTVVNLSDYPITAQMTDIYRQAGVHNVLRYPLDDRYFRHEEYSRLGDLLERLYQKMGNRVLVHCTAGINRSALLIAYSILRDSYLSAHDVIDRMKVSNTKWRRQQTLINPTFVDFLTKIRFTKN